MKRIIVSMAAFAVTSAPVFASGWEVPNQTDLYAAYCKEIVDEQMQPLALAVTQLDEGEKGVQKLVLAKKRINTYLASRPLVDTKELAATSRQAVLEESLLRNACSPTECLDKSSTEPEYESCFNAQQECIDRDPKLKAIQTRIRGCFSPDWPL